VNGLGARGLGGDIYRLRHPRGQPLTFFRIVLVRAADRLSPRPYIRGRGLYLRDGCKVARVPRQDAGLRGLSNTTLLFLDLPVQRIFLAGTLSPHRQANLLDTMHLSEAGTRVVSQPTARRDIGYTVECVAREEWTEYLAPIMASHRVAQRKMVVFVQDIKGS